MISVIYSTTATKEEAQHIADILVEERLAACVHILPKIESVYRWKNSIEHDEEYILFAKTTTKNSDAAIQRIKNLHSYDVPEILVLPVEHGLAEYLSYVEDETQ